MLASSGARSADSCRSGTWGRGRLQPRWVPRAQRRRRAAPGRLLAARSSASGPPSSVSRHCASQEPRAVVVCDQIGVLSGPLPRERHHIGTTATTARKAPPQRRAPSPAVTRSPAPITHTIRQPPAKATSGAHERSSAASASPSNQASSEFGFEGAGETTGSAPASSSSSSPSARAASAGAQSAPTTPSSSRPPPAASGHKASTEFGFE